MMGSRRSFSYEGGGRRPTRMGGLGSTMWKMNYELLCDNLNGGTARMDLFRLI
jgi:hypothetical protein